MDYVCLSEKGLVRFSELSEEDRENAVRVIVGCCSSSSSPFMHVVLSTASSTDNFAKERIVEDHTNVEGVCPKCDNTFARPMVIRGVPALKIAGGKVKTKN